MLNLHNILDLSSAMLGIVIFFIAWHGSIENNHTNLKLASLAILATSILDICHLMSYTELIISNSSYNCTDWVRYWIAGRIIWSCAVLYVVAISPKNSCTLKFIIYGVFSLTVGLISIIFLGSHSWPYIEINSHYHSAVRITLFVAVAADFLSLILLHRFCCGYIKTHFMQLALVFDLLANISYIIGTHSPTGFNFPAHILKALANYFLLLSVFRCVIKTPYDHLIKLKEKTEELAANNAKLYCESEQQRNLLEDILAKIGAIISSQLNLKDTLDVIADMVADMMHTRQSLIALLSNDQSNLQIVATYGINTFPTSLPLKNSLSGQVMNQNRTLYINNLTTDNTDIFKPQLIFSKVESMISAPLINDGHIIGVIEAYSSNANAFSERDALLLTALGYHAGAAIASAMMYEETKLRLEEEKYLSAIAQAAASSIDTDTIMEQCTAHTVKALNADIGLGFLINKEKNILTTVATVNFIHQLPFVDLNLYPKLARLIYDLKPASTTADIFVPIVDLYDEAAPRNIMLLPLAVNQRLLGLMVLGWQRFVPPERLNRISFANLVAQQIALGLEKAHLYNQVKSMALSDSLTGLANRRNFDMFLKTELRRATTLKRPLSLIMLDLDKFKTYNDTYGHVIGDKLLAQIGQILYNNIRNIDFPARYGGEEFSIILPECSNAEALSIAEKLRKVIEDSNFPDNVGTFSAHITASMGVATYDPALSATAVPADSEKIIAAADKALYQAKEQGRNKVVSVMLIE